MTRARLRLDALEPRVTPTNSPELILDIASGSNSSNPTAFAGIGGTVYFTAPLAISGGGAMNITGVLYAADALIDVSGNGNNFIGNQVVCWQMNFQGNGIFNVPWDPGQLPNVRDLRLVE